MKSEELRSGHLELFKKRDTASPRVGAVKSATRIITGI